MFPLGLPPVNLEFIIWLTSAFSSLKRAAQLDSKAKPESNFCERRQVPKRIVRWLLSSPFSYSLVLKNEWRLLAIMSKVELVFHQSNHLLLHFLRRSECFFHAVNKTLKIEEHSIPHLFTESSVFQTSLIILRFRSSDSLLLNGCIQTLINSWHKRHHVYPLFLGNVIARVHHLNANNNIHFYFHFHDEVMTDNAFKARDIGLRAQKKILSRMATKTVAKTFIDGTTASLLDNIYRLAKLHVSVLFAECLQEYQSLFVVWMSALSGSAWSWSNYYFCAEIN